MYRFSRALYRDLSPMLMEGPSRSDVPHRLLLSACERTVERIARDHRRFARPEARLFRDVRALFPIQRQLDVYSVIELHIATALEHMDQEVAERGSADLLRCRATNRRGRACQRVPVTGSDFCPSHRHLERLSRGMAVAAA